MKRVHESSLEWRFSNELVPYPQALTDMEERALKIHLGEQDELVWFLEHPPLYTAGTSAKAEDLLDPIFPVYQTGRGGQLTYHGPGQRVIYLMLDLKQRNPDLRAYIRHLEEWLIQALKKVSVSAERHTGRIGLWVRDQAGAEKKIAAIGVRIQKWVTLHGVALNVDPQLDHFKGIVPCGLPGYGVTSLKELGLSVTLSEMDKILQDTFPKVF